MKDTALLSDEHSLLMYSTGSRVYIVIFRLYYTGCGKIMKCI